MINMNAYTNTQAQADNEVIINGVSFGYLTDADTERIISIIRGMQDGKPLQAQAPTQAPKKAEPKAYEPATDVQVPITPVKAGTGKVAFTLGYGAGRAGAKLAVKNAGFAWDASYADDKHKGAYVGTTAQAKALGITAKSTKLTVSAQWVQAGRDKAAEKKAKKA